MLLPPLIAPVEKPLCQERFWTRLGMGATAPQFKRHIASPKCFDWSASLNKLASSMTAKGKLGQIPPKTTNFPSASAKPKRDSTLILTERLVEATKISTTEVTFPPLPRQNNPATSI
jgi:hypothetical protein